MNKNKEASKKSALLIKLPENIHAKLKLISANKGKSMNKLANEIIANYVNKHWEATKKEIDKLE